MTYFVQVRDTVRSQARPYNLTSEVRGFGLNKHVLPSNKGKDDLLESTFSQNTLGVKPKFCLKVCFGFLLMFGWQWAHIVFDTDSFIYLESQSSQI